MRQNHNRLIRLNAFSALYLKEQQRYKNGTKQIYYDEEARISESVSRQSPCVLRCKEEFEIIKAYTFSSPYSRCIVVKLKGKDGAEHWQIVKEYEDKHCRKT